MKLKISEVSKALIPILAACVAVVLLVTFVEPLALWLPGIMGLL